MTLTTPVELPGRTRFVDTTTLAPAAPDEDGRHRFTIHLDDSWASLNGVHGGYLAAITARAAAHVLPGRDVRTVAVSFLRAGRPGAAELTVEIVRDGRSLATVLVDVTQDGRRCAQARITATASGVTGVDWPEERPLPPPLDECVPFTPPPAVRHFAQAEMRLDPATLPTGDAASAEIRGWVRSHEADPADAAWLTMIGDWFPPTPFRRLPVPNGGVSVDYVVHVHRTLPEADRRWVGAVLRADASTDGLAVEHGRILASDGTLLAETFHTRWTA